MVFNPTLREATVFFSAPVSTTQLSMSFTTNSSVIFFFIAVLMISAGTDVFPFRLITMREFFAAAAIFFWSCVQPFTRLPTIVGADTVPSVVLSLSVSEVPGSVVVSSFLPSSLPESLGLLSESELLDERLRTTILNAAVQP